MKPEPRIVSEVCSLCGLDWKRHGKSATTETCIGLLLDEVRSLNARLAHQPIFKPLPHPVPYTPRPYPWWQTTWGGQYQYSNNATVLTPPIATITANAANVTTSALPR